jgi:hypothetical protein
MRLLIVSAIQGDTEWQAEGGMEYEISITAVSLCECENFSQDMMCVFREAGDM